MSWKMLFLISELCREAQLPSLCSLGLAYTDTKTFKKRLAMKNIQNYLASFIFFLPKTLINKMGGGKNTMMSSNLNSNHHLSTVVVHVISTAV